MIFLILLLAVCDAVHINSNYFKSDFIVPTDCTIQPTQQECMEYAQLTMTPEIVYLEVSYGQPATLYVEVPSGSAAAVVDSNYLSQDECPYADNIVQWSSDPPGCIKSGAAYFWNTAESTASCSDTKKPNCCLIRDGK